MVDKGEYSLVKKKKISKFIDFLKCQLYSVIHFAALSNQATVSSLLSGFDILMKVARFYSGAVIKKIGFGRKEKKKIRKLQEKKKKIEPQVIRCYGWV